MKCLLDRLVMLLYFSFRRKSKELDWRDQYGPDTSDD